MLIPAVVKSTFGLTTAVAPAVAGAELPMKAAATPTPTTTKTHGITIPTIAPADNPLLLLCLDTGNVEFVCASDLIFKDPNYWERVLDITTKTTYKGAIKCFQIMGRSDQII